MGVSLYHLSFPLATIDILMIDYHSLIFTRLSLWKVLLVFDPCDRGIMGADRAGGSERAGWKLLKGRMLSLLCHLQRATLILEVQFNLRIGS